MRRVLYEEEEVGRTEVWDDDTAVDVVLLVDLTGLCFKLLS